MDNAEMKDVLGFLSDLMEGTIKALPETIANPIEEVYKFRKTLLSETDRGCALMAAAYLDEKLAELLKAYLVDDTAVIKGLFGFNGAFGSFSSRIDSAYALGLIPANVRKDIHLLRKIRNDFAHVSDSLTFEDEPIVSRCRELYLDSKDNTSQARGKFTRAMMAATGVIQVSTLHLSRREVMADHNISLNQRGIDQLRSFLKEKGYSELVELVK